jgi:hypothetical protein
MLIKWNLLLFIADKRRVLPTGKPDDIKYYEVKMERQIID